MGLSIRSLAAVSFVLACVACGSTDGAPSGFQQSMNAGSTSSSEQAFTRTVVTLLPDGSRAVVQDSITRPQQLKEQQVLAARLEARKTGAKLTESLTEYGDCDEGNPCSNCAGSYLVTDLFDGTYGSGDEICFYNQGTDKDNVYLGNYCRQAGFICRSYWSGASIQSYATNTNEASAVLPCSNLLDCGSSCVNLGASGDLDEGSFSGDDYLMITTDGTTCNTCSLTCK